METNFRKETLGYNFIWFMGVVEDRLDPLKMGRVRVRCFSWHTEDKAKVPTKSLPWAQVILDPTNASLNGVGKSPTGILEGSWVFGFFLDGEDAQKPIVLGTLGGIPQNGPNPSVGFNDPDGRYPNILNEPDVSRLARNEYIVNTIVQNKIDDIESGVPIANTTETWSQPYVPYNAKYPFNKVWQTESGHIIELDDSPNSERINIHHRSGTFIEIDRNGTKVSKTTGNTFSIMERDNNVLVKGNVNLTIEGDANIYTKNNLNMDVDGNFNLKVKNDFNIDVSGATKFANKEGIKLLANTIGLESYTGAIDVYAKTNFNVTTENELNFKSTNDLNIDSAKIYLNSDKSSTASITSLSTPPVRAVVTPVVLPPLIDLNRNDEYALELDDEVAEGGVIPQSFTEQYINFGGATQSLLNDIPAIPAVSSGAIDESTSPTISPQNSTRDNTLNNRSDFPDTLQLSDNFTLADLSTKAVFPHRVRPQVGLSEAEIVQNLKGVAQNILEPIFAEYPDMLITSGFRVGSGRSQHYRGQAVDMQFTNASKADYYTRAVIIKGLISYDQFLLEYKNTGTGLPWLHISWSYDRLRNQRLTFFNHRKHSNGFTNLA